MSDPSKTKAQLIEEIARLRRRLSRLEGKSQKARGNRVRGAARAPRAEANLSQALSDSQQTAAEATALLEGARAVLEGRSFAEAAGAIFQACKGITGAAAGYIALLSPDGKQNEVAYLDPGGYPCTVPEEAPMPIRGFRAEAYRTGRTTYDNDFAASKFNRYLPAGHVRLDNVLFAPLNLQGKTIGLLGLGNKPGGFTEMDVRLASAFAELAAVALHNHQTLEHQETSEQKFRSVVETATEAIVNMDPAGKIVFWNAGAEKMFGYPAAAVLGKSFARVLTGPPRSLPLSMLRDLAGPGGEVVLRRPVLLMGRKRDGTDFPMELSLSKWNAGPETFFTGIIRDRSEQEQHEEELKKAAHEWQRTFDSIPDLIMIIDHQHRITRVNRAAAAALNATSQELTGRFCYQVVHGTNEPHPLCPHCRTLGEGGEHEAEIFEPRFQRHFLVTTGPLVQEDGQIAGSVHIMRDITAKKHSEEELHKHREHLEELVEGRTAEIKFVNRELKREVEERRQAEQALQKSVYQWQEAERIAQLGSWELDLSTNVLKWSDEIYRIFEIDSQKFGASYEAFLNAIHPEDRDLVNHAYTESVQDRTQYDIVHRLLMPDGRIKFAREVCKTYYDAAGKPLRSVGTVHDITERIRAEEAAKAAERLLEEQRARAIHADRLRSLGEMSAGIAHELNQPLQGVRGQAEHMIISLERGWPLTEQDIKDKARLIVEQADRMSHVIEHARQFARGSGDNALLPVAVNEVIESSLTMLGAQLKSHGFSTVCELAPELPLVSANPFSLEEVIINLISNARDAFDEPTRADHPPCIKIRTYLEPRPEPTVKIEVSDNGGGIPPGILEKVFDPFYTTKSADKGTGLGLPISKSIIEELNGKMEIASQPGEGTRVIITLPAKIGC